jgi:prophage tail gpP-like protein
MDSFDRVRFGGPFEPDDLELRAALRPLQFDDISVDVGGVRLFTGTKVNVSTVLSASSNTVSVECYSKPGVLNDCTMPASASEKLEFRDATLITIANALAAKFGLGVEYIGDVGPVFEQVAIKNGATVYSFLVGLVRQRNMVIANTAAGKLLIQRPVTPGKPVAELTEGLSPLMSVAPQIQSQKYYSHVTGMQPAWHGEGGDQYTQVNPRLNGVVRPWTFNVPDTDGAGIQEAVEAKAGRMFASAVQYDITVSTWRDSSGVLWLPNTTINVISPRSMIYTSYEFLIRSVSLTRSASGETATLKCILPGSLSGTVPETMPWD